MPYGYNPADFRKDYRFVAGATQAVAQGVIGYSEAEKEKQRRQEELQKEYAKAEKLAQENKNLMNISYKTIKNIASREIGELVNKGSIDEKTGQDMLKTLVKPGKFTTFKDYSTVTGEAFDDLMARISKIKQESLSEEVVESQKQQPQFSQPEIQPTEVSESGIKKYEVSKPGEVIGQTPGAETQQEIATSPGVASQAPTTQELEAIPAYKSAPTEQQLTKAKLEEEKLLISKTKTQIAQSKESNINWYREEMIKLKGMAQQLNEAKDDLSRERAREDLLNTEIAIRSLKTDAEKELKDMKNKTDEMGDPIPEDTIETAKKKKDIEHFDDMLRTISNLEMQTIKKGTTLKATTGEVIPAPAPKTSVVVPPIKTRTVMGEETELPSTKQITADSVRAILIKKYNLKGEELEQKVRDYLARHKK